MLAWVAEREYIHRKAGKCGCKLAVSVIALPRAVSAPPHALHLCTVRESKENVNQMLPI